MSGDPPSSAILVVYLDKAEELPVSHIYIFVMPSLPMFVLPRAPLPVPVV